MLRTTLALIGFLVAFGIAGPARGAESDPVLFDGEVALPWAVIGVEPHGGALIIGSTSGVDNCRVTRVDTLPALKEGALRFRLVSRYKDPADFCLPNDGDPGVVIERVNVEAGLRGPRISGPKMLKPSMVYSHLVDRGVGPLFSVVGLRVPLATDILTAAGFRPRDLRVVRRGRGGYVQSVSPKLPKRLKRSFKITIATR